MLSIFQARGPGVQLQRNRISKEEIKKGKLSLTLIISGANIPQLYSRRGLLAMSLFCVTY